MKRFLILLAVTACLAAAALAVDGLVPVKIYINTHDDVYKFPALGVSIEELKDGYIEARVTREKFDQLTNLGWKVEVRVIEPLDPKIPQQFHNYVQMTSFLDSIHALYPAITEKISIGQSVQGRELWAFLVTDNPGSAENEAEVRLAANMHGDETTGREMCLGMIDSLTKCYGTVPAIADLVNNREIWFMPALNPDGYENGVRGNANGMDLNRNYPVPDGTIGDDGTYVNAIETQHFIDFWTNKRAVLSFNYHGGALVANYPWDYDVTLCPDNTLAREISLGYARLNTPMYNNTSSFPDSGVTNGYEWYEVNGTLQDWSYHVTSCLDITLEISNTKWPAASTLPTFWSENRGGMLYFIRQAGWGVQGVITDSITGLPINRAQVDVGGINKPVFSDSLAGDYHRMLMTGNYNLTFSKPGYASKTFSSVRVKLDSVTNRNVQLAPILLSGTVTDSATALPIAGAIVEVVGVKRDTTDASGHYSIQAPQGTYTVTCAALGYGAKTVSNVALNGMVALDFVLGGLNLFGYSSYDTTAIPTSGAWITDSLYVDKNVAISDYRAYVNVTHTYKGDLVVRLFHPNGIDSIRLHQRSGGAGDNIIGWYPDSLKPADSLRWSALYGLNAKGWWKLRIKDYVVPADSGKLNNWALQIFSTQTGVASQPLERPLPVANQLFYGRPNPLTDRTSISFQLKTAGRVSLKVYNASGQLVRTLVDGHQSAGHHAVPWDGRDGRGERVASGVYVYRLDAGSYSATNKLVVVR